MRQLILHIGTHRTGTSALQQFFLMNRHVLDKNGVYYPLTGCNAEGMHHPLFQPLLKKSYKRFNILVVITFKEKVQILSYLIKTAHGKFAGHAL